MRPLGPVPALALAALLAALLAPVLSGNATFFFRDIHWVWYPWMESVARALAEGAWPLWDPHSGFGQPALANPAYQVAYPLAWPAWVLPGHHAYALFVLVHLWLAGLGTALLLRAWGASRAAATAGAALWLLSGPLLSFTSLHHHFAGLCWVPLVLWTIERALRTSVRAAGLAFGAALGLQLLAGSADLVVMTGLIAALRLALAIRPGPGGSLLRPATLAVLGLGLLVGVALAAVQWLPTLALVGGTARSHLGAQASLSWSLHPLSLLDFLAPAAVAGPGLPEGLRRSVFEGRAPFVQQLYLGVASLPLVLLGCCRGARPGRALVGLGLLLLLVLALGGHTPVYAALVEVPPFSMLRYPVKYVAPLSLLWALAAGLGLDAALRTWPVADRRWERGLAAGCGLVSLAFAAPSLAARWGLAMLPGGTIPESSTAALARSAACLALASCMLALWLRPGTRQLAALALAGLAMADAGLRAREALCLAPRALASYRPAWAAAQAVGTRLYVRRPAGAREAGLRPPPTGWTDDWWWSLGMQDMLAPPIAARWALDGSYDGDPVGLAPMPVHWLSWAIAARWGEPLARRLLQMGAVERVVSLEPEGWLGPQERVVESVFSRPLRVRTVADTLPRALLVEGARVVRDDQAYWTMVLAPVDPRRWVLLDAGRPQVPGPDPPGQVRVVGRSADGIAVDVEARRAAYLVLQESWEAGWLAWLDGARVPLRRANLIFRAVDVPAGRHRVELRYRPRAALWGAIVTAAALAGLALRLPRRRRS